MLSILRTSRGSCHAGFCHRVLGPLLPILSNLNEVYINFQLFLVKKMHIIEDEMKLFNITTIWKRSHQSLNINKCQQMSIILCIVSGTSCNAIAQLKSTNACAGDGSSGAVAIVPETLQKRDTVVEDCGFQPMICRLSDGLLSITCRH